MGSASGVEQVAARRIGMSLEQYRAKRKAGLKWCYAHADWHDVTNFDMDRSRGDGRTAKCREARYQRSTSGRPGMAERRQWAKRGFAWCRGCSMLAYGRLGEKRSLQVPRQRGEPGLLRGKAGSRYDRTSS